MKERYFSYKGIFYENEYSTSLCYLFIWYLTTPMYLENKMLSRYSWLSKKGITMGGGNLMDDVAQETVCVAIKRFNKISIIK